MVDSKWLSFPFLPTHPNMNKFRSKLPFALKASLFAATTLSLGAIAPAQAAQVSCEAGQGGMGLGWSVTGLSALNSASNGCFIGDKLYYNFRFTRISTGIYGFTKSGADHTFSGSSLNFTGTNFSYSYTVALFNPPAGQEFFKYNTNAAGSATSSALAFTKTLTPSVVTSPVSSITDESDPGNIVTFPSGTISPITFTSNLTRTGGKIDVITDSLTQLLEEPPATVPAPLPVLGAGAAFAFSRRLRNRIKQFS